MLHSKQNQASEAADAGWQGLCRIGGVAALIQFVCVPITLIVVFALGGEPSTADEYFTLLQDDRLEGLLRMDFPSLLSVALYALTFFGLYAALRRTHSAYIALATALGFAGLTLWLAAHSAFSMISLSNQYAAATTEAQRAQFLAAGEAVIAADMWHSTGPIVGGIFLQGGLVIVSVAMLQNRIFSKTTAILGLLTHGLDLAHIIIGIFAQEIGVYLMFVAGPLYPLWFILVGRRLLQLGSKYDADHNDRIEGKDLSN
jgi:hypothetical protein